MATIIFTGRLAVERRADDGLVSASVRRNVDMIGNLIAGNVAVRSVLLLQRLNVQRDANGRQLRIGQSYGPWLGRRQLRPNRNLVLDGGESLDVVLVLSAQALDHRDVLEVQGAIRGRNGRLVEVNRLQPIDQANNLALCDQIEDAEVFDGAKRVSRLDGRVRLAGAALGALDGGLLHRGVHGRIRGYRP